jgi:phosphatidylethanolamine/phosphatidyl-N-methylethanolamine N-methyltransferase
MRDSAVRAAARESEPAARHELIGAEPTAHAVVRTYNRFAPAYDRIFGRVLEPGRRAMTQAASALQPASVLEVGVGTGLTLAGYPQTARLVGIDLSADMLERARRRAMTMPERDVRLEVMNAERMDFADDSFDCVTVPYVLSVTPHPARLVQEIRRVCKPDGTVLVVNHFSGSPFWWLMERAVRSVADRVGFRSDFAYAEHILAHDWRVESVRSVNLFGLSKLVVLRNDKTAGVAAAARQTT